LSARLAKQIKLDLDEFSKINTDFPAASDFKKTILIIVDRSFDMMAPFIHEFTYQAMMHDILIADRPILRFIW
jgi:syntaxin-binding protein 1